MIFHSCRFLTIMVRNRDQTRFHMVVDSHHFPVQSTLDCARICISSSLHNWNCIAYPFALGDFWPLVFSLVVSVCGNTDVVWARRVDSALWVRRCETQVSRQRQPSQVTRGAGGHQLRQCYQYCKKCLKEGTLNFNIFYWSCQLCTCYKVERCNST